MMSDERSIRELLAEFEEDSSNLGEITEEVASYQVEAQTFSIPDSATLIFPDEPPAAEQESQASVPNPEVAEWALVCVAGKEIDQRIPIKDSLTLGRSSNADFSVDDTLISRRHVTVSLRADGLWVEDLNSSNGTFVNNKPVSYTSLNPGDKLTIGDAAFIIEGPQGEVKTVVRSESIPSMPDATIPQPSQRFCTQCGNKLKPETQFCIQCGKKY
jgi:hypothetical protein